MTVDPSMSLPEGHCFPYNTDPHVLTETCAGAVLVIPRRDIESRNVQPFLRLSAPWIVTKESLNLFGGRLIPVVDGYNADPRDIDQVPEIRAYFEDLDAAWPYLPFFLLPDVPCQSLYWMLVGDGRRSPDGSPRINFGRAKKVLSKQARFLEETSKLLAGLDAAPGEKEINTFEAAASVIADLLENRGKFLR